MKKKKGRILEENKNTYTEKDKEQYEEKREKEERVRESRGKTNTTCGEGRKEGERGGREA